MQKLTVRQQETLDLLLAETNISDIGRQMGICRNAVYRKIYRLLELKVIKRTRRGTYKLRK